MNLQADPSAHATPSSEDDLRIVHRTTVGGKFPFHAERLLPGVGWMDIDAPHPWNGDGVWLSGGLGFRWDEDIKMQN